MIKAAIFDVDGTLFDSMPFWMNAGTNFLQSLGSTTTEDLGNVLLSMSLEEGAEYLVKNYLPNMTASEVLGGIVDVMNEAYKNLIPLKKGAKNLLKKLSQNNIPVAIATATDRSLLEVALERLKISEYINQIFTCSECKTTKSVPDIYLKACDALGATSEQTVVFEDTLLAVSTACDAGFIVAAVKDLASAKDYEQIKEKAHIVIEDFDEFNLEIKK
ncbi:MAG: HAD family phosphatase [Treponema bryantii]|nr:HAD family phosphatase [Treponema bryantii]